MSFNLRHPNVTAEIYKRLNGDQVRKVVEDESGVTPQNNDTAFDQHLSFGWRPASTVKDQVYVLFMDAQNNVAEDETILDSLINWLVRNAQPAPIFVHTELLCLPLKDVDVDSNNVNNGKAHFSTYIGARAAWQTSKTDYYEKAGWRCLPIYHVDATNELRDKVMNVCQQVNNVPYSISRYVFAWSPLRWIPNKMSIPWTGIKSPGQCADVVARILKHATAQYVDKMLVDESVSYGPSTLYRALGQYILRTSAPNNALEIANMDSLLNEHLLQRRRFDNTCTYAATCKKQDEFKLLFAKGNVAKNISDAELENELSWLSDAVINALHSSDPEESVRCERFLAQAVIKWTALRAERESD